MAKSSIHIQAGKSGFLAHNDRSKKTVNSIFFDEENEIWNEKKEAFQIYRTELAARRAAYEKNTGQKMQKKAITHLSAIVNLKQNHTMKDLNKLSKHIEEIYDTRVFQIAIHRDEGHVKRGKNVKNYHAHVEFLGIDSEGKSIRKKLTKGNLSKLQSAVAKILEMERGTNYAKERKKRPKRLDTYEYKAHAEKIDEVQKSELRKRGEMRNENHAKIKELKEQIAKLREQMREQSMEREDYRKLEDLNKKLKEKIKEKSLKNEEMLKEIEELKIELFREKEKVKKQEENRQDLTLENEIKFLKIEVENKIKMIDELKFELAIVPNNRENEENLEKLKVENNELKIENNKLSNLVTKMGSILHRFFQIFKINAEDFTIENAENELEKIEKKSKRVPIENESLNYEFNENTTIKFE